MRDRHRHVWAVIFMCNALLHNTAIANPLYVPQYLSGNIGRNIRHLPCVSRRTGETGICMFAFTCAKANGTHLGTCIDRFYFGSCCKIDEEPDVSPQDNTIDDSPIPSARPFLTTPNSIESNDIPEYYPRPKPSLEKKPTTISSTVYATRATESTTTKTVIETSTKPYKITTKKPTFSIPTTTTTTEATKLSTFQTVQTAFQNRPTVPSQLSFTLTEKPQQPSTTVGISSSNTVLHKPKPSSPISLSFLSTVSQNIPSKNASTKPFVSSSYPTKRPIETTTVKIPHTTKKTTDATTTHTATPITRFPPRNATTTRTPVTRRPTTTTKKTPTTVKTRRPVTTTTKRPTTTNVRKTHPPTRRPVSTTPSSLGSLSLSTFKPSSIATNFSSVVPTEKPSSPLNIPFGGFKPSTKRPLDDKVTTTTERILTTIRTKTPTKPTKPSIPITTRRPITSAATRRPVNATTATKRPGSTTTATKRPIKPTTSKPSVLTTVNISDASTTTSRVPVRTSPRPRPTSKPSTVKPTSTVSSTTVSASSASLPSSSSVSSSSSSSPSSPSSSFVSLPLTSSVSSSSPSSLSTSTMLSRPSTLSTAPTFVSTTLNLTNASIPSSSIRPGFDNGTLTNEVLPQEQLEAGQTTHGTGFVTWSSNSDDLLTTKTPVLSSTVEQTVTTTESTPATTPDSWIIIQSPTTEKLETEPSWTLKPNITFTDQSSSVTFTMEETTTESTTQKQTTQTTTTTSTSPPPTTPVEEFKPLNMSNYKEVCGRRLFPQSRIVGGDISSFGKWPWQISLRQWRTTMYLHKCGATLLNENWAITAAHCVDNVPPSDLLLRIGEYDLTNEDEPYGFQERRVQIVASHPQFDATTFEYDIALLRFYEPLLPFQPNILPVCVPDDDEDYVGKMAYVTGWGRLYEDGPLPSVLQEVAVPIINNTICEGMYRSAGHIEHIPKIFICAGWRKGGFDSCEGDSGGPLVIQRPRDKRWILAGVISWGIGCAEPNQPGVYTRISEFREWINQILQF